MVAAVSGIYLLGFAPYKIVKIGQAKDLKRRLDNYYYQSVQSFPGRVFEYDHDLIERIASCVFLVGFSPLKVSELDACETQHLSLARKHLQPLPKTKEWFQVSSFNYECVRRLVGIGSPCPGDFPASVVRKYILPRI